MNVHRLRLCVVAIFIFMLCVLISGCATTQLSTASFGISHKLQGKVAIYWKSVRTGSITSNSTPTKYKQYIQEIFEQAFLDVTVVSKLENVAQSNSDVVAIIDFTQGISGINIHHYVNLSVYGKNDEELFSQEKSSFRLNWAHSAKDHREATIKTFTPVISELIVDDRFVHYMSLSESTEYASRFSSYQKQILTAAHPSVLESATAAIHSPEEEKDRLLVVPLKAQKGIDQEEAILLTDILSVEIHRSGKFIILNREDMKAILDEKEFELAMGCEDNICLLENVAKLAANKIVAGNIGKLGKKYIISIRMINEDGENEVMASESCACEVDKLDETIKQISYKFLSYLAGEEVYTPESVVSREEPSYGSAISTKLRSSYRDLSVSQVQSMPNMSIRAKLKKGFLGHSTINHNYEMKPINGEKVVIDHATRLMWHQNGSDEYIKRKKAQKWIADLNKEGYAGYNNWRLPTIEEAASLLEPVRRNGDLYINLIFEYKQKWIWTGDKKHGSKSPWLVSFGDGAVYRHVRLGTIEVSNSYHSIYVRPVRSVE